MGKSISIIASFLLCVILLVSCLPICFAEDVYTDPWGYTDDDGDGLILVTRPGETYTAYMLIVLDPTRVIVGCRPDTMGSKGYVLEDYVSQFNAVAGINAGGFQDYNGQGDGSTPESVLCRGGEIICGGLGIGNGFCGIDSDGILQIDFAHVEEISERNIMEGAGFGPVLIRDGEIVNEQKLAQSNLNPRTAIGQRADGALLLLVIDGRQPNSLGGTFLDAANLMLEFGAITANNLDGGSSSLLWIDGGYINNKADVIEAREMPSSFLVLPEGKKHTEVFQEKFEKEMAKLDKETLAQKKEPEKPEDDIQGTERDELVSFATEYINRYVMYTADLHFKSGGYYYDLVQLVVPYGPLQTRLHQAGGFGFVCAKECTAENFRTQSCSSAGDNEYVVEMTYDTVTRGHSDFVTETRNIRLHVVRNGEKLLASAMTMY